MKKISEDLKTCNKYKPDESSEKYKDRVLMVGQFPFKEGVIGSNPIRLTKKIIETVIIYVICKFYDFKMVKRPSFV